MRVHPHAAAYHHRLANQGMGLGAAWGRHKALEMLGTAGFEDVPVEQLPHDFLNDYYIARKEPA